MYWHLPQTYVFLCADWICVCVCVCACLHCVHIIYQEDKFASVPVGLFNKNLSCQTNFPFRNCVSEPVNLTVFIFMIGT